MRVLLIKKGVSAIGGSETHARALARTLAARGHDVTLAGLRPPWRRAGLDGAAELADGRARIALLPTRLGRLGAALDALLPTELLDGGRARALAAGVQVVHCVAREYAGVAERLARETRAAFVITPLVHPGQLLAGEAPADIARYRRADAVCAMTRWEAAWYAARGVPGDRVHVTGVGPVLEREIPEREPEPATILFVGRRERYKGYYALAGAMTLVWRARPDARVLAVGQRAWHAPLTDRLYPALRDARWQDLGIADERAKAAAYARAALLCVPSRHESFGQVYLEAWLARRPVIAADIPPVRELVDGAGLLVPQRPAAIASAILALLEDPQRARELGARGRERALAHHTWAAVAARVEQVYEKATAVSRSRGTPS